jgi:hypothetical protein
VVFCEASARLVRPGIGTHSSFSDTERVRERRDGRTDRAGDQEKDSDGSWICHGDDVPIDPSAETQSKE